MAEEHLIWHTKKRKINDLIPYDGNPRQMSKKQVADLTKSIERFDLVEIPAIDTDNKIIAGHQRLKILQLLGRGDEEIDVRMPNRKLTDGEFREYLLRSNKNLGEFNWDMLANWDEDMLRAVGFDEELDKMFPKEVEEDEVPEVKEEVVSKLGEVYQLGKHRLGCMDSTVKEDVEKLMDGKKADMSFNDPPYFVGLTSTGLNISQADKENILHFFKPWVMNIKKYSKGHWYICTDWRTYPVLYLPIIEILGRMTNLIIWDFEWIKAGSQYRFTHELILFGDMENGKQVPRGEPDVWRIQCENFTTERLHGAAKPIELCSRAINNSSQENQIILDLFGGSGSTLIACEQTNRTCYMMELDPKYCDVIRRRYWKFVNDGNEEGWQEGTKK